MAKEEREYKYSEEKILSEEGHVYLEVWDVYQLSDGTFIEKLRYTQQLA